MLTRSMGLRHPNKTCCCGKQCNLFTTGAVQPPTMIEAHSGTVAMTSFQKGDMALVQGLKKLNRLKPKTIHA